jgi:hypothetical protein
MVSTAELHTDSQIGRFDPLSKNGPLLTNLRVVLSLWSLSEYGLISIRAGHDVPSGAPFEHRNASCRQ